MTRRSIDRATAQRMRAGVIGLLECCRCLYPFVKSPTATFHDAGCPAHAMTLGFATAHAGARAQTRKEQEMIDVNVKWDQRGLAAYERGPFKGALRRTLRKAGSTALRDMRSEASKRIRARKRLSRQSACSLARCVMQLSYWAAKARQP